MTLGISPHEDRGHDSFHSVEELILVVDDYPLTSGRSQLQMGTKPLIPAEWIDINPDFAAELAEKERLLQEHPAQVFVALPESQTAQQETLTLLLEHLQIYAPNLYRWNHDTVVNQQTGQVWERDQFAPLDLAGRLVQEDWVLLQSSQAGYILVAGSVCFPLRWSLPAKLGQPMTQIHAPVPGYQQKLSRPVDALFDRLKPGYPVWRINWNIVDTPALFLPPEQDQQEHNLTITNENAGEKLWLRRERQSLRRLPLSEHILFGIHTYLFPLQQVVQQPGMAAQLAAAIAEMPVAMQTYKSLSLIRTPLLDYLQQKTQSKS